MSGVQCVAGQQLAPCIATTKSGMFFSTAPSLELQTILVRLRHSLAKRGVRGWRLLCQSLMQYDHRNDGKITRLDWDRLNKSWGLGLAPDERDAIFKGYVGNDGKMNYNQCIERVKGVLTPERANAIRKLFDSLKSDSGVVSTTALTSSFHPQASAPCLIGQRKPDDVVKEYKDAVHFFCSDASDWERFRSFCHILSALYEEDDEFSLMIGPAHGLPSN